MSVCLVSGHLHQFLDRCCRRKRSSYIRQECGQLSDQTPSKHPSVGDYSWSREKSKIYGWRNRSFTSSTQQIKQVGSTQKSLFSLCWPKRSELQGVRSWSGGDTNLLACATFQVYLTMRKHL